MKSTLAIFRWRELSHKAIRENYPGYERVRYDGQLKRILNVLQCRFPSETNLSWAVCFLRSCKLRAQEIETLIRRDNRFEEFDSQCMSAFVDDCFSYQHARENGDTGAPEQADVLFQPSFSGAPSMTLTARREHLESALDIAGRLP